MRRDGFCVETGPESFISYKPAAIELCKAVGLECDLIEPRPENRKTFVMLRGKLVEMPEGILSIFSQPALRVAKTFLGTRLLSWRGKIRLCMGPLMGRGRDANADDESLASFFKRRVGMELFENLMEPLLSGVYGGDAGSLSMKVLLKPFFEAEKKHGSLFRAVLAANASETRRDGAGKSVFISLRGGLGSLAEKTAAALAGVEKRCGAAAAGVEKRDGGYSVALADGEAVRADAVLLALPAFAASSLLRRLDGELAGELDAIPYDSSAVVTLGFDRGAIRHDLRGYGFIVPKKERLPIIACTWSSSKWEERAPDGKVLLRCYIDNPDADPREMQVEALQSLTPILGIQRAPMLSMVHAHPRSMPQYVVGHEARAARIAALAKKHAGLFLAGSAFDGVGIPDCVRSGKTAAERILSSL